MAQVVWGWRGGTKNGIAGIFFQSFLWEAIMSSSDMDRGHPLFDVVHPAFSQPTRVSPTLQGALKDSFGEAVLAQHAQTM